jgi:hypothetical protein
MPGGALQGGVRGSYKNAVSNVGAALRTAIPPSWDHRSDGAGLPHSSISTSGSPGVSPSRTFTRGGKPRHNAADPRRQDLRFLLKQDAPPIVQSGAYHNMLGGATDCTIIDCVKIDCSTGDFA